jgi:hypothetical protein
LGVESNSLRTFILAGSQSLAYDNAYFRENKDDYIQSLTDEITIVQYKFAVKQPMHKIFIKFEADGDASEDEFNGDVDLSGSDTECDEEMKEESQNKESEE